MHSKLNRITYQYLSYHFEILTHLSSQSSNFALYVIGMYSQHSLLNIATQNPSNKFKHSFPLSKKKRRISHSFICLPIRHRQKRSRFRHIRHTSRTYNKYDIQNPIPYRKSHTHPQYEYDKVTSITLPATPKPQVP